MNACMCPIIANCCLIGSCGRADIRSFFFWVPKESQIETRADGGTLYAPSGGRMLQHSWPFVCAYVCVERVFVHLRVNLKNVPFQVREQYCMFVRGGHPASAENPDKDRRNGLHLHASVPAKSNIIHLTKRVRCSPGLNSPADTGT